MKLPAWARRRRVEREMEEEIAFHLASHAERLMRAGVEEAEAWRRARAEFGSVAGQKEAMRGALGLAWWDDLLGDVRYAWRALRRSPGFAAVAVASLALGIGVNTAIFTLTSHLLLSRLDVPRAAELRLFEWTGDKKVAVHEMWGQWDTLPDGRTTSSSFSYPVYERLRSAKTGLGGLVGFKDAGRVNVTIGGAAETVRAEMVSGNYYVDLGVRPQMGRPILPADDATPGSGAVVVISDGFWARRFGRAKNVVGKKIAVNLTPVTIVGVNPEGFTGVESAQGSPEIFLPLSMQPVVSPMGRRSLLSDPEMWWVQILAREGPGGDERKTRAALDVALNAAVRSTITLGAGESVPRIALADGSRGLNAGRGFAKPIYVLMGLAGLVLLLACANIANLLLARAEARQREMTVRLALGAGRGRILRQVFTESLVLAALGGAAGLALGYASRNLIPALMANSWARNPWASGFDWRVFAFCAALTVATGLLFGLAPAWRATRTEAGAGLKETTHTATRRAGLSGRALVALQLTLATMLVAGAGLFLRTVVKLDAVPLGFNPDHLILFEIAPPATRYPPPQDVLVLRRIEEAMEAVPGVEGATLSAIPLIADSMENNGFVPEGAKKDPAHPDASTALLNVVGERFFPTMQTAIVAGRGFDGRDTETSAKVAVVNEALAREFFGGRNPVGRTFTTNEFLTGKDVVVQIVGLCEDARYARLRQEPPALFYLPYRQAYGAGGGMTFEVRTRLPLKAIVGPLRRAVQVVDRDLPLIDVRTEREQIAATMDQERLFANLSAGFGVLALVLAATGVYGLMAYTVARRTNEIGIRMALGARAGQVMRMVLGEVSWIAVTGVAAGLGAAAGLTRLVEAILYGVKPRDPVSLAAAGVVLGAVALAAGWLPARRAAKLDPMAALRHE